MAVITREQLENASRDANDFALIVNGPATDTINTRYGGPVPTVRHVLQNMATVNPRGNWATSTAYAVKDVVIQGGVPYIVVQAHTSGVFADDLAAKRLTIYSNGASSDDVAAVAAKPIEGKTWPNAQKIDWTDVRSYIPGMDRIPGVSKLGAATATINNTNELEVAAVYSSADRVVLPGFRYREGILRAGFRRGSYFMVGITHANGERFIVWNATGTNFEYGFQKADGTLVPYGSVALPAGADNDTLLFEMIRGPWADGLAYVMRVWMEGGLYPLTPTAGVSISAPAEPAVNDGFLSISSFSGQNARLRFIEIVDTVQAEASAYFVGRWFRRFEGARPVMTTVRGGSRFRLKLTGAAALAMRCAGPPFQTQSPVVDLFVDGVRGPAITVNAPGSSVGGIGLLTGLDPSRTYYIEGRVRGVHEHDAKFAYGNGLCIESFYTDTFGGRMEPWVDDRPKALFIGDSITEGILARAAPSVPANSGGDLSWPQIVADHYGLQAVVNGFGGTGLTVPGSGSIPSADYNAFYYMNDRPIDTAAENIKYIFLNHGTNDNGQGVSTATFQAAYIAFLSKLLRAYPSAIGIYAIVPFNGVYKTQIQNAVNALGRAKITFIDGSAIPGITYTDGTHPNVAGEQAAADGIIAAVGPLFPSYD